MVAIPRKCWILVIGYPYQDKKGSEITGLEFKKAEWSLSRTPIPTWNIHDTAFSLFNFMPTNAHKDLFVFSYKFSFINMIMSASNPKEGGVGSTL